MGCDACQSAKAVMLQHKTREKLCKQCFYESFEKGVHQTILDENMFSVGEKVVVGMSGGKDSTVLAYVLDLLNKRHNYNLQLDLLCIDEGISGYRDQSLKMARRNQRLLGLNMLVLSFGELFGKTMDGVVESYGHRGSCTRCGAMRRKAMETGARMLGASCIATGHNADDVAETVLLNLFRGDANRLRRCTLARTRDAEIPRCKPFKFTTQREIVMYAFYKGLEYFSTECTYSPGAFRGDMRVYIKSLENIDPGYILNIIRSGDDFLC